MTHYHVLWKDTEHKLHLLCVKAKHAASAIRNTDDYLGESLYSVVDVVAMEDKPYFECTADDIKAHLENYFQKV